MNRILIVASCATLFSFMASSQGESTGLGVLKIPQTSRLASLNAIAVSEAGHLGYSPLNPAAMIRPDSAVEVLFTYVSWLQGTKATSLVASIEAPMGRVSLATGSISVDDIEVRTQPGPPLSTFNAQTGFIRGGYALKPSQGILFGLAASYVYDKIYVHEATGWGFDAGVIVTSLAEGLSLGGSIINAGSVSGHSSKASDLPTQLTFGGTYAIQFGDLLLRPGAAIQQTSSFGSAVHAGLSATYLDLVTFRSSWNSGESARKAAFGASVFYGGFALDYAVTVVTDGLGTGHILSLSMIL